MPKLGYEDGAFITTLWERVCVGSSSCLSLFPILGALEWALIWEIGGFLVSQGIRKDEPCMEDGGRVDLERKRENVCGNEKEKGERKNSARFHARRGGGLFPLLSLTFMLPSPPYSHIACEGLPFWHVEEALPPRSSNERPCFSHPLQWEER